MTHNGRQISWLEYRSMKTGKSIEELKNEMRERGAKANKSKSGFASLTPERLKEVAKKGYDAGLGKKRDGLE